MKNKLLLFSKILSGNAFSQMIVIFTTPLLTRLYSVDDFGVLGLVNAILLIVGVIGCLRYDQLMYSTINEKDWNIFYSNSIFSSFLVSVFAFFVLMILNSAYDYLNFELIILVSLMIFLFSITQILSASLAVHRFYVYISNSFLLKSIFVFVSQYMLFDYLGSSALIWGLVLGQFFQVTILFLLVSKETKLVYSFSCLMFPSKNSISSTVQSLSNSFSSQLPSIIIPSKFSMELMGYYSMALRLTYLPITFFSNALRPYLLGELNRKRNEHASVFNTLLYGSLILLLFSIIGVVLIYFFSKPFFILYAGPEWELSGDISVVLSFWIMTAFSNIISTCYLTVYSKFKELLVYDSLLLVARLMVVMFMLLLNFTFFEFITAYSIVGSFFNFCIIFFAIKLGYDEKNSNSYNS
ncbi:oligosaccharide flippase family protein [Shewanella sp. AS16]|uniref:oligosaccharide flippase family protein n=1 Tax=Shewanella sp. AS16 TaxID=2907625 RepID=UPI001F3D3476|nr:oligosaccharide flippase family protein [Shewanella sp. AS16]MCE9686736.1 oligosaccharide flippase family protein [Shewanella sp. AS16]